MKINPLMLVLWLYALLQANSFVVTAQDVNTWAKENIFPIDTIGVVAKDDYKDLAFLKDEIGDKSIVMLGEQNHLDGASFRAKARLVRFLLDEMGFEAVLFESGFYDVQRAVQYGAEKKEPKTFSRGLYFLWRMSGSLQPLWSDLAARPNIQYDGFDCKITSPIAKPFLVADMKKAMQQINYQYVNAKRGQLFELVLQKVADKYEKMQLKKIFSDKEFENFQQVGDELAQQFHKNGDTRWERQLRTLLQAVSMYHQYGGNIVHAKKNPTHDRLLKLDSLRDAEMYKNLHWLLQNKYANKKVIVWGATYHIMSNSQLVGSVAGRTTVLQAEKVRTLGDHLQKQYGEQIYRIGFIAATGKYGIYFKPGKGKEVQFPPINSLENYLHATGLPFAYVRLQHYDKVNTQYPVLRIHGSNENTCSEHWSRVLDGVFYTKEMQPNLLVFKK